MATTIDVIEDLIEELLNLGATPSGIAGDVLDLLGIAHDKAEASTLVESVNGTFGLAYEPSSLSDTAGPRVKFLTSPDPHHVISAHVRMDGQVEVRTEGMGYSMIVRPDATNAATVAVEDHR